MDLLVLVISIILNGYFLITTPVKVVFYWVAILLYFIVTLGALVKVFHYPGADELLMIGLSSQLLAGGIMIWSGVKAEDRKLKIVKVLLGTLMIIQMILILPFSAEIASRQLAIPHILTYVILLITGWIILSKAARHIPERNLLYVILIQAILAIVSYLKTLN